MNYLLLLNDNQLLSIYRYFAYPDIISLLKNKKNQEMALYYSHIIYTDSRTSFAYCPGAGIVQKIIRSFIRDNIINISYVSPSISILQTTKGIVQLISWREHISKEYSLPYVIGIILDSKRIPMMRIYKFNKHGDLIASSDISEKYCYETYFEILLE